MESDHGDAFVAGCQQASRPADGGRVRRGGPRVDAQLARGAPAPGTEDSDRLQFLSVLVEAYQNEHEPPMPEVAPPELSRFMLEQQGMTRAEVAPLRIAKARVSEFNKPEPSAIDRDKR